jgi:hypothetical protein
VRERVGEHARESLEERTEKNLEKSIIIRTKINARFASSAK